MNRRFHPGTSQRGVTLIELMIALILLGVLAALAVPSFLDFRERSVARSVGEEFVSELANFRFEAIKRNREVTVAFVGAAPGTALCIGAREGDVACDCSVSPNTCDIGTFPDAGGTGFRGARLLARTGFSAAGGLTFDPATGMLTDVAHAGTLTVGSPSADYDYQLQLRVNALGRAQLCVPVGERELTGYPSC